MRKLLVLIGADENTILLRVLITILFLSALEIFQMRLFPYLDDWTLFLISKWNKGKRRGQVA